MTRHTQTLEPPNMKRSTCNIDLACAPAAHRGCDVFVCLFIYVGMFANGRMADVAENPLPPQWRNQKSNALPFHACLRRWCAPTKIGTKHSRRSAMRNSWRQPRKRLTCIRRITATRSCMCSTIRRNLVITLRYVQVSISCPKAPKNRLSGQCDFMGYYAAAAAAVAACRARLVLACRCYKLECTSPKWRRVRANFLVFGVLGILVSVNCIFQYIIRSFN